MNPNEDLPEPAARPEMSEAQAKAWAAIPGPAPIPVPAEIMEWARQNHNEEEIAAGLKEIFETGGVSSEEFLRTLATLEQAARDDG
jgi:hypothetical protein